MEENLDTTGLLSADFGKDIGIVRPALHSSGFGPTICSQTALDLEDVKSMGFTYARTHDWALINANERVCDLHHIFPLMHLDATKPENYVFGPTDYLLKRTREEAGFDVFYRLGTSIEHSGNKIHFNALIPEDFDKVAEVFAGTVRHYNRGWANGFSWNIKYWEIWNEPEGIVNMWCPPEGTEGLTKEQEAAVRAECRAKFVTFFVTVLKRLKAEFGDEIKVGGPALCWLNPVWFNDILSACQKAGIAPDFISWHDYTDGPWHFSEMAEEGRKMLDSYGFTDCEMIVNEWHYFGYQDYNWNEMQRCSDPKVKARIWSGPRSHNGIKSACFTLAALADMQRSKLDQAYFYGCRHTGAWGFKNENQEKYKVFYALKLFGDLIRKYGTICAAEHTRDVTVFAVKDAAGKKALLVADYAGGTRSLEIAVAGLADGPEPKATLLDYTHDLALCGEGDLADFVPVLKDGVLTLPKPDDNPAAFFVEFEEGQLR